MMTKKFPKRKQKIESKAKHDITLFVVDIAKEVFDSKRIKYDRRYINKNKYSQSIKFTFTIRDYYNSNSTNVFHFITALYEMILKIIDELRTSGLIKYIKVSMTSSPGIGHKKGILINIPNELYTIYNQYPDKFLDVHYASLRRKGSNNGNNKD